MSTLDEIIKEKQRLGEALARVDAQRDKLTSQLSELEAIDLSRPAALLRLPQPGRSCQPDIAVASTTIDPLAGDRGFESTSIRY